jgi:ABC-type phosphate/phosphonate transport system substrate-binding protein
MESGKLAFGRMGPSSLVYLLDKPAGVDLLAIQDHINPLTLAIFTRADSPLARMADTNASLRQILQDRSFAFGDVKSTTGNFVPKWYLVQRGIYATNLARYAQLGGQGQVIDAVENGKFDAGAANRDLVRKPNLRILATESLSDLGLCWVASKGLDAKSAGHLRQCLLALDAPAILAKLESDVRGFKPLSGQALQPLREIMAGAARFSAGSK